MRSSPSMRRTTVAAVLTEEVGTLRARLRRAWMALYDLTDVADAIEEEARSCACSATERDLLAALLAEVKALRRDIAEGVATHLQGLLK